MVAVECAWPRGVSHCGSKSLAEYVLASLLPLTLLLPRSIQVLRVAGGSGAGHDAIMVLVRAFAGRSSDMLKVSSAGICAPPHAVD